MALLCPCEETLQEESQKHVSMFQGGEGVSLSAGSTIFYDCFHYKKAS